MGSGPKKSNTIICPGLLCNGMDIRGQRACLPGAFFWPGKYSPYVSTTFPTYSPVVRPYSPCSYDACALSSTVVIKDPCCIETLSGDMPCCLLFLSVSFAVPVTSSAYPQIHVVVFILHQYLSRSLTQIPCSGRKTNHTAHLGDPRVCSSRTDASPEGVI